MSFFIFAACVALHVAWGARPVRDWDFSRRSLELSNSNLKQPSLAEDSTAQLTKECRELEKVLKDLGIRGRGNPCSWDGVECSSECQPSSLIKDGKMRGNLRKALVFNSPLNHLKTLKLRNAKVKGPLRFLGSMDQLENLDLSGTLVQGNIDDLKVMKKLKTVNLRDTKVAGSFNPLKSLTLLELLELGNTKTNGNLIKLAKLRNFRHLGLENTGAEGSVTSLKPLKQLQFLDLSNTAVKGSIASLKSLTQLESLDVSNTTMDGDIQDLQSLSDLQVLQLGNTEVKGKVSVLADFTGLEKLDLDNILVHGNLDFVTNLTALHSLQLHNTDVKGDFSSVQTLTNLQELTLSNTDVVGNLEVFENLTQLRVLKVSSTKVGGSLSSLQRLQGLQVLKCSNTRVTGVLKDLQHFTQLEALLLNNVNLEGDLSALEQLPNLRDLRLYKSKVSGDIKVLQNFPRLQYLDLAFTQVSGDVKALQQLIRLEKLYLAFTNVKGSIAAFQNLTKLQAVGLREVWLHGDVSAFRSMGRLHMMGLSKTQVSGDIESLRNLTSLKRLLLSNTKVHGNIQVIVGFPALEDALMEDTAVSGWIEPTTWLGCCQHLKKINLAETKVGPLPHLHGVMTFSTQTALLPALNSLNVSGCRSLSGWIDDFLVPFAGSSLSTLVASGCDLRGDVPNIAAMKARVDEVDHGDWRSFLSQSLQTLDLSSNSLTAVPAVMASVRMDLRNNQVPLKVPPAMLLQAVEKGTELWLENTTLANREEVKPFLSRELRLGELFTRDTGSFFCRYLADRMLSATPELFLPDQMCVCRPGFNGTATVCSPCPANTYSSETNSPQCLPCPQNSAAPAASASWKDCVCAIGTIQDKNGTLRCECPSGEAFLEAQPGPERCESCSKLKLECPKAGSNASTAAVQDGYARLQTPSHNVYQCLDAARCRSFGCAKGYTGRLCSDCAVGYHANLGRCKQCIDVQNISGAKMALIALCGSGALALLVAAVWAARRRLDFQSDIRLKCAAQLLAPQLAALLQLVQLWVVLQRLARPLDDEIDVTAANATANRVEDSQGDVWASYLEMLQFTAEELQGLVALQCIFDGATVRVLFAVVTPLVPLALLLACCLVEFVTVGKGIQFGLQLLTVLFIGGASGATHLLDCQRLDGTGKVVLGEFAFRPVMPHLLCTEETWVDQVGRACAFCYGVLIPSFLAFLFAKQHLVMRQTKTFVPQYEGGGEKVTLQLQMVGKKENWKEGSREKKLVAAAAVYVAVHVRGRALVTLAADQSEVTVEQIPAAEGPSNLEAENADLSVDLLVSRRDEAAVLRSRGRIIRHNTLVQMLTERSILADIQTDRSDRIMLGAKNLLGKYASCQFVWMEVCLKLASAALVSVVGSKDGLWLSIAITVSMALMVCISQPFARPQENTLYTLCFACLALAAVGFCQLRSWLSHAALVLPVFLVVISLARPDSQEALAMRLHEELEAKLHDGPVEVSAERVQFF